MTNIPSEKAGAELGRLVQQVGQSHEPVEITDGKRAAVLVSIEDWRAIQETLYLASIPGMRDSIREGLAAPTEECSSDPGW